MTQGEIAAATADLPRVLVIEDDRGVQGLLKEFLREQGFAVATADDGLQGIDAYAAEAFDAVLLDIRMPGLDGLQVLERLRLQDPEAAVIILTGHGSVESAVQAIKAGAADYLTKPVDLDHLELALQRALKSRQQVRELRLLKEQLWHRGSFEGLIGVSPPMQRVYELIRRLAPGNTTVLIQGETGTGKELVARALHNLSPRRGKGFMAINCGALPEAILESELFGHEKGAFTGAIKLKYGLIEQAEGGTLFLDEIEEMSPALQVKLLRALQEREVLRVGGDRPIAVDFRLLAATNVDLRERLAQEAFRPDLFYRLSVVTIDLPPLRARPEDIPLLAEHFLRRYAEKHHRQLQGFAPEAMQLLQAYSWPGNVRELENVVEQAVVLGQEGWIRAADLPAYLAPGLSASSQEEFLPFRQARAAFEQRYLQEALRRANGVVAEAARLAGMPRQYFYEKMKRFGISRE